jgi:AAA15 family ATPase/GTPase
MRVKEIIIENFKAFKKVRIECNENFNFIVGENNIGKSTILEAIQLWKASFDTLIQKSGNKFYGQSTPCYLPIDNLIFLRISDVDDLFHNARINIKISLIIIHETEEFVLEVELEKPDKIDTYFRVKYDFDSFNLFKNKVSELGLNLRNVIFLNKAIPVFKAIKNEPFYNNAQILKKIALGKSNEVIRNKILRCEHPVGGFGLLENRLNKILKSNIKISVKNRNKQDEEYVRITLQEDGKKEVDLALIGSGVIQVLEIFSTLELVNKNENGLNILLIDEPDSHIHSNLQSGIIDQLRADEKNQVFLISHNDRLINKAEDGELFYVNKISIEGGLIQSLPKNCYTNVAVELAGELLDLSPEEKSKIIVITEGKTDKKTLEKAWEKLNPAVVCPFHFIASGFHLDEEKKNGSAREARNTVEFVSSIVNDIKLVGLFDNDREGNEQLSGLRAEIFEPFVLNNIQRKHKTKDVYGLCLPVPEFRTKFVTSNKITQRYLVIEHYFSDEIIVANNLKGDNILDTEVFDISGDKNKFADKLDELTPECFDNFTLIFDKILELFVLEGVLIEEAVN